jgi:DHA3 family macrolide efflux protein-like MFS transporter
VSTSPVVCSIDFNKFQVPKGGKIMQSTSSSTTHSTVQPGQRTFYSLAAAQTVSQIGSNMSFLAVGIYVYLRTGEATPLALFSLFLLLPHIIAGGVAGVLADRYDRRALMIIGDTGAALGSLALVISVSSGNFQLWHLYAAGLWQALFSSIQRPAFEASVSQLVPEAQRQRANAIMQISKPASILIASALTGFLYVAIGVVGIFLIDLISFLVAVSTTLLVRIPSPPRSESATQARPSMLKDWGAGLGFLWSRRPLFIMVTLGAVSSFLITSVYALTTPYVLARTGSEVTLGFITAIMSVGGIVGAIAIGAWGGFKRRMNTIMIGIILLFIATILFGTNQSPIVLGGALFLAMMGVSAANATLMTLLQAKVPGDMQGRVFAIFMQLTLVLTPLGYLLIGPLADQVFTPLAGSAAWAEGVPGMLFGMGAAGGMGVLFAITGILGLVVALITYVLPSVRNMEATLPTYSSAADVSSVSNPAVAEANLSED